MVSPVTGLKKETPMGYALTEEQRELKRKAGRLGAKAQQDKYVKTKVQAKYKLEAALQADQELFAEIAQLKEHVKVLDQVVPGTDIVIDWDEWFFYATSVLRGCNWDKAYPDLNSEERYLDEDREYKDKVFFDIFPDAAADSLLRSYHKFSPELLQFLVKTLEAFLQWYERHPEQHLDYIPEIQAALRKLKNGQTLYDEAIVKNLQARYQEQQRIQKAEETERIRRNAEEQYKVEEPKQSEHTPDPMVAGLSASYQPPLQPGLEQAAWDYLRTGRKF
jgi:hypothetical protein